MPIEFGRQVCGSLSEASAREWLVTDGLGGYAMGTVAGLRTRRYHGLLMVAGDAANGADAGVSRRMLGLAAVDPTLVIGDRRIRLATHEWASGVVDPAGHVELESFTLTLGIPKWRWVIGDITFEREIAMVHGRPGSRSHIGSSTLRVRCASSSLRCARGETAMATAAPAAILRSKRWRTVSCSSTRTACAARIGARADPGTAACALEPRPNAAWVTPRICGRQAVSRRCCNRARVRTSSRGRVTSIGDPLRPLRS